MALITYKEWKLALGESSPSTRQRNGWAMGNYPPSASVMSRSTPSPFIMDKAIKEFGKKKRKKKKKDSK